MGFRSNSRFSKDQLIWFAQTEADFNAWNKTAEQTKFDHLVTSLDHNIAPRKQTPLN